MWYKVDRAKEPDTKGRQSNMELAISRKNVKWIEELKKHLLEEEDEVFCEEEAVCEHFAYKKTLLFYTEDCRCCRYAQAVKNTDGSRTYACKCADCASNSCAG